jgi:transcriptional regulator with XRE-family HTH domain
VNDVAAPLGAWLRRERERRNWSRSEMARRLIEAAESNGDYTTPGIGNVTHNLYRWERGTVTPGERYRLYFCEAFGIPLDQFGVLKNDPDVTHLKFKGPVTVSITIRNNGAQISIASHPDPAAG